MGLDQRIVMRPALLSDVPAILGILDEAAGWLRDRCIRQWPPRFEAEWIEPDILAGNTWVAVRRDVVHGTLVHGTLTLTDSDRLWSEAIDGEALYLHRLAIRRDATGLGSRMIAWADQQAAQGGHGRLRLDCVASNASLCRYYVRAGFEYMGTSEVGGHPGDRDGAPGTTTTVARYERPTGGVGRLPVGIAALEPRPELDQVMARAWPAAITGHVDGWLLRATGGVTRRANSALVVGEPLSIDDTLMQVEDFAGRHEVPAVLLVSDALAPASIHATLEARGYRAQALTWLLMAEVSQLVDPSAATQDWTIDVTDHVNDEWFDTYWSVESERHGGGAEMVMRNQLLRPPSPARFVTVSRRGEPVSVGQVVIDGEIACLQCLVTTPTGRRRGAARAVLGALFAEAEREGATTVFAAVMASNRPSLSLCRDVGLRPVHSYRYHVRD